jgi:hypothetical protein
MSTSDVVSTLAQLFISATVAVMDNRDSGSTCTVRKSRSVEFLQKEEQEQNHQI